MAKRWMGTALGLFLGTALVAQQDPQFTQYMFNLLALNPAYAGSAERVSMKALTRHQWVGFTGAPTTQTLTVHSPLVHESLGIGGTIMRDSHGPVTQYGFLADISYRIFMGDAKLAFGLKGGLNLFQGDFAELNPLVAGDQVFQANVSSKMDPQFGFGMMYYSDRYFIGLSAPKLMRTEFFETDSLAFVSQPGQRPHYFLTGGYVFDLGLYHKFKPTFLVKAVQGAPASFDLSANFLFYEKFWLGAMYRHTDAVGALAQYHITNDFTVGYAYDYPLSTLNNYSGGSHEIMLGFDFGNKMKGVRSPRYF
ncbi:MAG: type IX secretion system membrane protein PorP/SprF [Flavobacteriales bacterium]|nr:type IX secretion system membrane protein PorP/SprF [Flavobacteriales bacterium]HRH69254.1 type IX secretion system membrane protein PorP/SprF [Flavobacteriales bacterium]